MTNNELNTKIKLVSENEATPALADFWQKQYTETFVKKASFDSVSATGFIDLIQHLTTDRKDIDHDPLQHTIAVLVRFLDAVCEDLDYRSINLSVSNFEEFLKITDTPVQIGVDYIGGLVADFSYRASENLAHEKGSYLKFKDQPKHIRPVEYEMWIDDQNNYKSGQELSTMFDDNTIKNSLWKLVPRRNFAILDFPKEPIYWDKWRDSYHLETVLGKKSISVNSSDILNDVSKSVFVSPDSDKPFKTDFIFGDEVKEAGDLGRDLGHDIENIESSTTEAEVISGSDGLENEDRSKINQPDLKSDDTAKTDMAVDKAGENIDIDDEKTDLETELIHEDGFISQDEEFVLGELVKVVDAESPWHDQVFQIVDITNDGIKLASEDQSIGSYVWSKKQLAKQNLYEILSYLNDSNKNQTKDNTGYICTYSAGLVINQHNQVLLCKNSLSDTDDWVLPSVEIRLNQIPEEAILKFFQSLHISSPRILDEVGSVMSFYDPSQPTSKNIIYNVFHIDPQVDGDRLDNIFEQEKVLEFKYFNISELPTNHILVKVALDKFNRHQKLLSDMLSVKKQEWEKMFKDEIEQEIRTEYDIKLQNEIEKLEFERINPTSASNTHFNQLEFDKSSNTSDFDSHKNVQEQFNDEHGEFGGVADLSTDQNTVTQNLAKFVKAELTARIQSQDFGDINLVLGYSSKGVDSISIAENNFDKELKSTLDLIIRLFNHLLSHGLKLNTLLEGLDLKNGVNQVPITEAVMLILQALQDAPISIKDLDETMLI